MTITPETCGVCGAVYEYRRHYPHNVCRRCYHAEIASRERISQEQVIGAGRTVLEAYADFAAAVIRDAIACRDFEFLRTTGRQWARIIECDLEEYDQRINDIECKAQQRKVEAYLRMAAKSSAR